MASTSQEDGVTKDDQGLQVLRFPGYNIEDALRQNSERGVYMANNGQLPEDVLELDYEVVDAASVPQLHEKLREAVQGRLAGASSSRHSRNGSHSPGPSSPSLLRPASSSQQPPSRIMTPPAPSPIPSSASRISSALPRSPSPKPLKKAPKRSRYRASPGKPGKKLNARQARSLRKTELARSRRRDKAKARDARNEISPHVVNVAQSSEPVSIRGFNAISLPASDPAWIGKRELPKAQRFPESKLKDFDWNGKVTVVLLDALDRIWAVLGAPPPSAKDWEELNRGLMKELGDYDRNSAFSKKDMGNRRSGGGYGPRNEGVSHGGGQPRPGNIAIRGITNQAAIKAFSTSSYLGRLVGHTGRLYATYANRLATESRRVMKELALRIPGLEYPSHPSPEGGYWAARCINSAGLSQVAAVCTLPHTDLENWVPGWCCVTAIGDYNPDKGGHLVFWNVGLRIRFPPGCSVLFPSATITHSNTPVQPGEQRYSIVEFSAGGLFRWVYNGFITEEELLASLDEDGMKRWAVDRAARWKEEVRMYTKWYEIERGDYQGIVLDGESDLSEVSESEDERPAKKRRI
ncbi:hypothetical protein VNI00_015844 [Paramarasmius palmivorus]|uniref:Uncharacterized protein n=1 Tax=Paramarasmius palmivorus TaxID=297713 RepID=A0AAW0BIY7_9AGAR